MEGLGRN